MFSSQKWCHCLTDCLWSNICGPLAKSAMFGASFQWVVTKEISLALTDDTGPRNLWDHATAVSAVITLPVPDKGIRPPRPPSPPLLCSSAPTAHECVRPELVSPATPMPMIEDYLHNDIVGNNGLPESPDITILSSLLSLAVCVVQISNKSSEGNLGSEMAV